MTASLDNQNDASDAQSATSNVAVPETIVGELRAATAPTHRSGTTDLIDLVYDFHPGCLAVRVDGPDVMAVACDSSVAFTTASLVTPETTIPLDQSADLFVGSHNNHAVFRIVLDSVDDAKRYSTGWIQR